jgi:uncharacterized MnhB-related membrane protein
LYCCYSARNFATAATRGAYREKTVKQTWFSDKGVSNFVDMVTFSTTVLIAVVYVTQSFPIIIIISGAVVFCAASCSYFLFLTPDSRLTNKSRKSLFRGELRGYDREILKESLAGAAVEEHAH